MSKLSDVYNSITSLPKDNTEKKETKDNSNKENNK